MRFKSLFEKNYRSEKKLDTILDFGRILRVSKHISIPARENSRFYNLSGDKLVASLKDLQMDGSEIRCPTIFDTGKIIKEVCRKLKKMALDNNYPLSQLHALYALKGLLMPFPSILIEPGPLEAVRNGIHMLLFLLEDSLLRFNVKQCKEGFI